MHRMILGRELWVAGAEVARAAVPRPSRQKAARRERSMVKSESKRN
jgi:hypothetical protein